MVEVLASAVVVLNTQRCSIEEGSGIRTTVLLKRCPPR